MWADAVFEGGGVKGIGLVGALCVAEQRGYKWKNVAGTSAGSIIAALVAAGYTGDELHKILQKQNFSDFISRSWYNWIPFIGPAMRLWIKQGMYSGNQLEKWLDKLLQAKGIRTFADFKTGIELNIIASDITRGQLLVLPRDLALYGIDPSNMSVARVVRMSCSIPFFFEPVKITHKPSNTTCYIVDGGVLSNFPVWLFDQDNPRWPTFGFRLTGDITYKREIHGPLSMLLSIFYTMMDAHDNRSIREHEKVRTIIVPSLDVKMTDFSVSPQKKEELFRSGVRAAEAFFDQFKFANYLAARGIKEQPQVAIQPIEQKEV